MQPLVDGPRDHLTEERVRELLTGDEVVVTAGCELLNTSNALVADISEDLSWGKVERDNTAEVHGTCSLALTRELVWGVDRVRPYITLGSPTEQSVVVTERLANLCTNPSLETSSSGWWYYSGGAGGTTSRVLTGGISDGAFFRLTFTGTQPSAVDCGVYDLEMVQVEPGHTYSLRVWARTNVEGQDLHASIEWFAADGTTQVSAKTHGTTRSATADEWMEYTLFTASAPTGAAFARMAMYSDSTTAALWVAGNTLDVDHYIFVEGLDCPAYFDGDTPDTADATYAWVDTAHTSASVRTMTTTVDTTEARFNLGVYLLTTPNEPRGLSPITYEVDGYDLLTLLHTTGPGDTYVVDAGDFYLTAVEDAITAAGVGVPVSLDGTSAATQLPDAMVWALTPQGGATWLQIINDLLRAVGYRELWADADGTYRSEPYVDPANRLVEWTFDTTDASTNLVGQDRTLNSDAFDVPNWWRFVRQHMTVTPIEGAGLYTVQDTSGSPTSSGTVGRVVRKVVFLEAADQDSLVAQGDRIVAEDKGRAVRVEAKIETLPIAGHRDVVRLIDGNRNDKCQVLSWELNLDGSQGTWVLEVVE